MCRHPPEKARWTASTWRLGLGRTAVLWHAEKPTQTTFTHNEAATSALVRYALSTERLN